MAAFPANESGRLPHRKFRGLRGVHSYYGSLGCSLPIANSFPASSDVSVTLPVVAIATGVDRQFPGENFHLLESNSFMTHSFVLRHSSLLRGRDRVTQWVREMRQNS